MPEEETPRPPVRIGATTTRVNAADARAEAALENERAAKDGALDIVVRTLTDQNNTLEGLLAKEQTRSRWLMYSFVSMTLLVLMMLGSAVGIVTSGSVSIPGVGQVSVGPKDGEEAGEVLTHPEEIREHAAPEDTDLPAEDGAPFDEPEPEYAPDD